MAATNDQIDQDVNKIGWITKLILGSFIVSAVSGLYGFNVVADDVNENTELATRNQMNIAALKDDVSDVKQKMASLETGQETILRELQSQREAQQRDAALNRELINKLLDKELGR